MNKKIFTITFLCLFALTFNLFASERAVKNYREKFCKDKSIAQLQQKHDLTKQENDQMIKKGKDACNGSGRQALSDCKSYRYGKTRKKLHKNNVIIKGIKQELQSRQKQ